MKTKNEIISYCKTFKDVYEDYPFPLHKFAAMRCKGNKKIFAGVYEMNDTFRINVKADPEWIDVWKQTYASVIPGYHMNKKYWLTIIADGSIPEKEIQRMIAESYDLVKPKKKPSSMVKQR